MMLTETKYKESYKIFFKESNSISKLHTKHHLKDTFLELNLHLSFFD